MESAAPQREAHLPELKEVSGQKEEVNMDAMKQSHTSSELNLIKGYLFWVKLTDHSPLHKRGRGTESRNQKKESAHVLYLGNYRIRYQLKEFPQHLFLSSASWVMSKP